MSEWKHDDLAADLKAYLSENKAARMIWCDMQLGPAGSPRPDVYAVPKSYSRFLPFAYEVKVSRSDFQTDVNAGKWQKYYAFASAVVFAVPDGLLKTTEIPDGAGLYVRKAATWRMAKAPKVNHLDNLPRETWLKLVMDGIHRLDERGREAFSERFNRDRIVKQRLGAEIAKMISDRDNVEWQIKQEIENHTNRLENIKRLNEADRQRAAEKEIFAESQFAKLCQIFGLPAGSHAHTVQRAINDAVRTLDCDERVQDLISVIENAERALSAAKLRVANSSRSAAA